MGKDKKTTGPVGDVVQMCKCTGCKKKEAKFTFCDEHYEWFKFGLITKTGIKVSDFEKKFEHFANYLAKQAPGYKAA